MREGKLHCCTSRSSRFCVDRRLVLLFLTGVPLLVANCGSGPVGIVEHPFLNTKPSPERVPTLDHGLVTIPRTGRVTVLEFWATYCEPCLKQLPGLDDLQPQWGQRVSLVAVAADDNPGLVRRVVDELGLSFPVVVDGQYRVLFGRYRVSDLPRTFLFDRCGRLRYALGALQEDSRLVENLVAKLLQEGE